MPSYQKPAQRLNTENKIFPHQVGFTSRPYNFDAAPTDVLSISPKGLIGAHGRILHVPGYQHSLPQRADNFHLLEEFVECMANNGADVRAQVGSNWVHTISKKIDKFQKFFENISNKYQIHFHMARLALIEGLRAIGAEKIALNGVYHWPSWLARQGAVFARGGF